MATAPDHGAIAKGDGAAHPLGYVQSADPGAIGADRPWCDTTNAASNHFILKIRNSGDTGWLTMNAEYLGGTAAASYALLASPTFTGTPAAPTAAANTNTTQLATTAYVQGELADMAPLASPTFTGTPAAPTATSGTNTTQIATTAFVADAVSGLGTAMGVSSQSGTSYTFVLGDANDYVRFTSASAVAATVPPNSSVAYAIGTTIHIEQADAGAVTITAGSGVTINAHADFTLVTDGQYAVASVTKVATDTWIAYGKLVPA